MAKKCELFPLVNKKTNDESIKEAEDEKSSNKSTSFNYINSILGSGIICMPYAIKNAGLALGLPMLVIISLISNSTLKLVIHNGELAGSASYQGVMEKCFGRTGFIITSIIQLLYPFFTIVSYQVAVGDTLTNLFSALLGEDSDQSFVVIHDRQFLIAATSLTIVLPLALLRNVSRLSKVSLFSSSSIIVLIISVIMRYPTYSTSQEMVSQEEVSLAGVIKAACLIVSSYTCHHNSLILYHSMKDKTESNWSMVTNYTTATVFTAFLIFGIGGFLTFRDNTQGNILENYCDNDTLINIARIVYTITILLSSPIECFVAREVIFNMFCSDQISVSLFPHIIITILIIFSSTILSMFINCLGTVMAINGLYISIPLSCILPPLCYLILNKSTSTLCSSLAPLAQIITGSLLLVLGTIFLIEQPISSCTHSVSQSFCK